MAAECESSASGSSASSRKNADLLEVLWKRLHSENSSKEKTKFKVSCKFCREELAYHGATSAMHEHLKCKHPTETEGDQPRTRYMDLNLKWNVCLKLCAFL